MNICTALFLNCSEYFSIFDVKTLDMLLYLRNENT